MYFAIFGIKLSTWEWHRMSCQSSLKWHAHLRTTACFSRYLGNSYRISFLRLKMKFSFSIHSEWFANDMLQFLNRDGILNHFASDFFWKNIHFGYITELVWLQILASAWQREYSVCNFSDIETFKRFCIYWTPELGNVRQPLPLGLHDASIMCKMKPKLDIPFAQNLLSCRVSS